MRISIVALSIILSSCYTIPVNGGYGGSLCSQLNGAAIVANDGTFLGYISNQYAPKSVLNEYGTFGSEYSLNSIWNTYGTYGSEFSMQSPFNEYSTTPPFIVIDGQAIGYLTTNKYLQSAVNPYYLKSCGY